MTSCAIGEVVAAGRALRPGEGVRRCVVRDVLRERIVERATGAAEIDASPEAAVVDLDPRVRFIDDHAGLDAEMQRGHEEGKRAMAAHAFLREREIEIDVTA